MRSNYSRGGKRGNFNNGGQGRGGYQGDRQQRDGDRPQTSGGGYYKQNRGGDYNSFNNGGGNRFGGGDMDSSRYSDSGRGRFGGGGRGRGGKPWDNQGRDGGRFQNNRDGGPPKFHSGPTKSLQSMCSPEEAQVQKVQFHTNQYKMTIGDQAPQIFQYSVSIEGWDTKK